MSKRTNKRRRRGHSTKRGSYAAGGRLFRPLHIEKLEDRRMLSVAGGADANDDEAIQLFSTSTALFVENQGQWQDESVRYGFDGPGVNIAFTDEGLSFLLTEREKIEDQSETTDAPDPLDPLADDRLDDPDDYITHSTQFTVSFDGANEVTPVGFDQSESRFNYFVGDTSTHRSNVAGYTTVAYEGLYEGIDLHTFGRRNSLKYEFYVAPGADYQQISVSYDGIEGLWIDEVGSLHVETELGQLVDDAPYIFQMIDGEEVEVAGQFSLVDSDTYTFEITGAYDPDVELVVDPNLDWSTYLGGGGTDYGIGIAVDGSGNALVTGKTSSSSSGWVSGGWDTSIDGIYQDGFVVKLTSGGSHLWSSYLGGSDNDPGTRGIPILGGIAVDGSGNALVTGTTGSSGWVSGGWDTSYGGYDDGFVAKILVVNLLPPSAAAGGSYSVAEGSNVTLSASGSSDADGTIVSYLWDLDNDGQYDNASGLTTNFSRTNDGSYTVGLKVIDNDGGEDTDSATVTVTNIAPTADAGGDYSVTLGGSVMLDATDSDDPGDDIVSYLWDLDNDGQFDDATGATPLFTPSASGSFTVSVRVTDDDAATNVDSATLVVTLPPGDYDANGLVDQLDYDTWVASYGQAVSPGTGADGNNNGIVDAADYTIWRDNLIPPATSTFVQEIQTDIVAETIAETVAEPVANLVTASENPVDARFALFSLERTGRPERIHRHFRAAERPAVTLRDDTLLLLAESKNHSRWERTAEQEFGARDEAFSQKESLEEDWLALDTGWQRPL